ncbi:MAG: hypothetical protein LBI19_06825 [Oscillospiraceae bacterium]|nr:hypothetical protein [Oscillospiraceae bacterium]
MNTLMQQDKEFGEFLENEKFYDKAHTELYELARAAFKAGWEKGEEQAKQEKE